METTVAKAATFFSGDYSGDYLVTVTRRVFEDERSHRPRLTIDGAPKPRWTKATERDFRDQYGERTATIHREFITAYEKHFALVALMALGASTDRLQWSARDGWRLPSAPGFCSYIVEVEPLVTIDPEDR